MRHLATLLLLTACAGNPEPAAEAPAAEAPAPVPAPEPVPEPAAAPLPSPDTLASSAGPIVIQPLLHATMALELGGKTWIVDPWTKAQLGDRKADVVLVTDEHFDHLDPAAIDQVRKEGTIVVGPKVIEGKTKVDVVIANGETQEVAGVKVTAVPMYNLVRGPEAGKLFHDKGRGNGYVLELGDARLYIAGDTECTDEMKALTDIDVAFVPMNLPYTMTPEEAAACVLAFKPAVLYPFHYTDADLSKLDEPLKDSGVEVRKREWYAGGLPF